jgi:hypothetical protein
LHPRTFEPENAYERPQIRQIQLRSKRANCIVKVPLPWVADRNEVE